MKSGKLFTFQFAFFIFTFWWNKNTNEKCKVQSEKLQSVLVEQAKAATFCFIASYALMFWDVVRY